MTNLRSRFRAKYRLALGRYLSSALHLSAARRLGDEAVRCGLELLEVARIHENALTREISALPAGPPPAPLIRKAGTFFAEVILPIEAIHRGAREAALSLGRLNRKLTRRSTELAASNSKLKQEIRRRSEIEADLKKSERHYAQLLKESAFLQERLRHLSHQILTTQEEERKRISRELHDQIAPSLTGINIELSTLRGRTRGANRLLKQRIARTQQLVQDSVEVIHTFARDLRPASLDDLGLIPALHSFTKTFSKQSRLPVQLNIFAGVESLANASRTVLYRVAQEALTNVAKHARATSVQVDIQRLNGCALLTIRDNGKSFSADRLPCRRGNNGLGLLGMRERVEMIGGTFAIESAPGQGTTVHARIPFRLQRKPKPSTPPPPSPQKKP